MFSVLKGKYIKTYSMVYFKKGDKNKKKSLSGSQTSNAETGSKILLARRL